MPSNRVYDLLEFSRIKENVASFSILQKTKSQLLLALPNFSLDVCKKTLEYTREADLLLNKYLLDPLLPFDDVDELLEKARVDATLSMGELLKVARVLRSARVLKSTVASSPDDVVLLKELTGGLLIEKQLEKIIFDSIISDSEMSDRASDKLYGLRRKIATLNIKLKEKLNSYTKNNNSSKYLQDNLVTVREGRYVLPVKAECRSSVPGIVHDRSATGSTIFVEPFAIVELNNELREAILEEQIEIENILKELTKRVSGLVDAIKTTQSTCILFDIILCKAKYSTKIKGVIPSFNTKNHLKLLKARHPLIDREKVVPIDLKIGDGYSVLLITGPNTGGKTVSLKTAGLFCLMAYFGLYLPCAEADVCVFDDIFCDIGDDQSIENELSTFSSHVSALVEIVNNMTTNSLVLLDEVGGGTDPEEGAALAIGILDYIIKAKATAVLTTHYGQVKEYAMSAKNVMNASMQFDERSFAPTFKLIIGMPGTSNALKIAKKLGLNSSIIDCAEQNLSNDKVVFEEILHNAEKIQRECLEELQNTAKIKEDLIKEKIEIEKKRKQIEAQYDKLRQNALVETKRLVSHSVDKANEIIDEMHELLRVADEAAILKAKKLRRELENLDFALNNESVSIECAPIEPNEIVIGKQVVVKTIGAVGQVTSVNHKKKEAEVQVGSIKTKVSFVDLGKKLVEKQKDEPKKKVMQGERAGSGFSQKEIMVIGLTVSEAIEQIEPLLISMFSEDDAKQLRIVHGKGTGALGKGIQSYLKKSPMVIDFRYGRYGEGDNGVTIVNVK